MDHSVFVRRQDNGSEVLAVHVDDNLLTGSDIVKISETKEYLQKHFVTKDMGRPRCFLRIEFAYKKDKIILTQRKYALDLLQKARLLGCKPETTLVDQKPN